MSAVHWRLVAEELGINPTELAGLHRRFEVIPGTQTQVAPCGQEGKVLAHMGIAKVYPFYVTLWYLLDPFCDCIACQDLQDLLR